MTTERIPQTEKPLVDGPVDTTPWNDARERLANPEPGRHSWLATVRPDGRPHLMPVLTFWIEGALHFLAGEGTRKGRNLAEDGRCVIGIESRALPSLDLVLEGRAEPLSDVAAVRRITEQFSANGWPLEARGAEVHGPNAPTAGPPPYRIYRVDALEGFGFPGTYGMEQFKQEELPHPTRWTFAAD